MASSFFKRAVDDILRIRNSGADDIEAAGAGAEPVSSAADAEKIQVWVIMLVAFCFSSAVQFAVTTVAFGSKNLPVQVHLLYLDILVGGSSLALSKLVQPKSLRLSQILRRIGFLCVGSSFYLAIAIPLPLYFKIICLLLFLVVVSVSVFSGRC